MVQRTKNQNALVKGMWNAICDRCGFKFKSVDLKEEWNGLMTCRDCWEIRQPLDFVRGVRDDQNVAWTRPDICTVGAYTKVDGSTDNTFCEPVTTVGDVNKNLGIINSNTAGWGVNLATNIYIWDTPLTANRLIGTLTGRNEVEGDMLTVHKEALGADLVIINGGINFPVNTIRVIPDIKATIKLVYSDGNWTEHSYTPSPL